MFLLLFSHFSCWAAALGVGGQQFRARQMEQEDRGDSQIENICEWRKQKIMASPWIDFRSCQNFKLCVKSEWQEECYTKQSNTAWIIYWQEEPTSIGLLISLLLIVLYCANLLYWMHLQSTCSCISLFFLCDFETISEAVSSEHDFLWLGQSRLIAVVSVK